MASEREAAFTLTELATVLAVIALMSALLLPALAASRSPAQAYQCLENQRRMVLAWCLYSGDFGGQLAYNVSSASGSTQNGWVQGTVDSAPNITNTLAIKAGSLFPYTRSVEIYKCPADPTTVNPYYPRVRSISMNCWLNPIFPWNSRCLVFTNQAGITNPTPANLWVFLDENPLSINDGYFVCDPSNPTRWVDLPASYHAGGCGISFADGHALIRKWTDPTVFRGMVNGATGVPPQQNPPADLPWLQAHSTLARSR